MTEPAAEGLTFEKVWAMFQETDRILKAHAQEIALIQKENAQQQKETDRQLKENAEQIKETDRQMKETGKRLERLSNNVGGLNRSLGGFVEILIAAKVWEQFAAFPIISSGPTAGFPFMMRTTALYPI
ncbi:MAG: hypothetical protein LBD37_00350 [Treponema sp.]|jgi:hypothetical protein|nr:hypothetical protein [Treponema sp.]